MGHLQYHKGGKVGECVVWDMCDLVKGERHGLQGWKGVQSHYWDLRQGVVIQPQVSQGANPSEGPGRNLRQQISIKTPTSRDNHHV